MKKGSVKIRRQCAHELEAKTGYLCGRRRIILYKYSIMPKIIGHTGKRGGILYAL